MNENNKIAGIYVRVSTEEQSREGFSLQEQEDRLRKFCQFKRYSFDKVLKICYYEYVKETCIK